jgi:hypothetical protein
MLFVAYPCHVKTIPRSNPVAPEPILSVDLILRVLRVPHARRPAARPLVRATYSFSGDAV